jgi:hypothetical protein
MAKGEARFSYNPGEKPVVSPPVADGDYVLALKSKGKAGKKGWRKKPGTKKFPNRSILFSIGGTEDELTGDEKTVRWYLSLSPKALRQMGELAYAVGYPEPMDFPLYRKPSDPNVMIAAEFADKLLNFIEENDTPIHARLGSEEFQGEDQNKIRRFITEDEAEESDEDDSSFDDEDSDEEETKPAKKGKAAKEEPEDEDEGDEEESDDEETDETEEAEETEEAANEDEEVEDSEDDEEAEVDEDTEDSEDEEPEEKPTKKVSKKKPAAKAGKKGKKK